MLPDLFILAKKGKFLIFRDTIDKYGLRLNFQALNENGENILLYCCNRSMNEYSLKLINYYGELCNSHIYDFYGCTSLMSAISDDSTELGLELLRLNSTWLTINLLNKNGYSALTQSIITDNKLIFDWLINDSRTNINITNNRGENALFIAMNHSFSSKKHINYYYVNMLLNKDIIIDQKTIFNTSSLLLTTNFPSYIVDKMINKKNKKGSKRDFRIFDISEFESFDQKSLCGGSFGEIKFAIEKSTSEVKILKRYINYDGTIEFETDVVKEILYINLLNDKSDSAVILEGICLNKSNVYIIMKPLDLMISSYFKIINKLPQREKYILQLIENFIKTIYKIHCLGICHNDIKFDNIMVNNGEVFMIDFGISEYMLFASNNENYDTTSFIKAPDNQDKIIYKYRSDEIIINSNRHSYSSDVYSMGVTLINLILRKILRYVYIKKYDTIFKIVKSELIPISENEKEKIIDCGDSIYELIIGMINNNSLERITLPDILGINNKNIKFPISNYIPINVNFFQNKLLKSMIHYSPEEIRFERNECIYIEQIHNSYKNDVIEIEKTFDYDIINWMISFVNSYNELPLDIILNSILLSRNTNCKKLLNASCIIKFCNCAMSSDFIFPSSFIEFSKYNFTEEEFINSYNELIMNNQKFIPFTINIEYIVYKMQCFNVDSETISKFEWCAIKETFKFLIGFKGGSVCMYDFTLHILSIFSDEIFKKFNESVKSTYDYDFESNHNFISIFR